MTALFYLLLFPTAWIPLALLFKLLTGQSSRSSTQLEKAGIGLASLCVLGMAFQAIHLVAVRHQTEAGISLIVAAWIAFWVVMAGVVLLEIRARR